MKDLIDQISKHKTERNMAVKIGKAKFGFTQKKYFKLKDGESTFRILPPLGELADEGVWSKFYKIHYGYKNTKGKLRVFQSSLVENRKTKMIEVPDAAAARIKDLKLKLEAAKAAGQKAVVEKLGPLVSGQKPMYNLDSNHYMNVIDTQGNICFLKLRQRAKQQLDIEIKKLREKGIDPLSVENGRYFTFTRTGSGLDTSFGVKVGQEKLNIAGVGEVNRDIVHVLSDELISRLGDEAAQLDKLFKALTADEIERIVKESDLLTGQSPAIDEIFDAKGDGDAAEGDAGDEGGEEASTGTEDAQASAPATETKVETKTEVKAEVKTETKPAQTAVEKVTAQVASKPEVTPAASAATTTTAEQVAGMSDADFLKSLGLS